MRLKKGQHILFASCFVFALCFSTLFGQDLSAERELHKQVLKNLRKDLKEHYYDPKLKGIDLEANLKKADELIDGAKSGGEMADIVARVLYPFDDSHLYFIPPPKTVRVDYGLKLMPVGDKIIVTELDEESDAWKKGVRAGDQIYMLDGFIASREHFNLLSYHYSVLAPRSKLKLIIIKPTGNRYQVEIDARVIKESVFRPTTRELYLRFENDFVARTRQGYHDQIPGLAIWKIPSFEFSDIKVGKMIGKIKNDRALILDLRGNGGGLVYSLEELIKVFFEGSVIVGKAVHRKGTSEIKIEGSGKDSFSGKLVVLIDGESAPAAEVFARVVQLEKRGIVIGDRSSGQVMTSTVIQHLHGLDNRIPYAFSVTTADLIMKDNQRLEKVGVVPDELVLPTPGDLANNRDPVLARAAKVLGFLITPEEAGKIFAGK